MKKALESRKTLLRQATMLLLLFGLCCPIASANGDWKRHAIDVHLQVFEIELHGQSPMGSGIDVEIFDFENRKWEKRTTDRAGRVEIRIESWVPEGKGYLAARAQAEDYLKARVISIPGFSRSRWKETRVDIDAHGFGVDIRIYVDLRESQGSQPSLQGTSDAPPDSSPTGNGTSLPGNVGGGVPDSKAFSTDFSSGSAGLVTEWDVVPAGGELLLGSRSATGQIFVPGEYDNFIFNVDYRRIQEGNCFVCMSFFFRETWSIHPVGGYNLILTCYENNNCTWWLKVNDSNDSGKFNVLATQADVSNIPYSSHVQITVKDRHVVVEIAGREVLNLSGLELDRSGQLGVYVNTDSIRCYVALDNLEVQPLR